MKRHFLSSSAMLRMSCLLSACLLLLCGCASIKVLETWNKPQVPGHHYQKLMIVGIGHDDFRGPELMPMRLSRPTFLTAQLRSWSGAPR